MTYEEQGSMTTIDEGDGVLTLFDDVTLFIGAGFEALGVATIVVGTVIAAVHALKSMLGKATQSAYKLFRQEVGRAILLGLEFLVAGDIIRTIVIAPTLKNVAVLGMIVLTRIVLSIALQVELEGHWPWRRQNRLCHEAHQKTEIDQDH